MKKKDVVTARGNKMRTTRDDCWFYGSSAFLACYLLYVFYFGSEEIKKANILALPAVVIMALMFGFGYIGYHFVNK